MAEQGPFRRLLGHMKGHRSTIRLASFCSITNKIWDLAPPLLIGLAVDVVVEREDMILIQKVGVPIIEGGLGDMILTLMMKVVTDTKGSIIRREIMVVRGEDIILILMK